MQLEEQLQQLQEQKQHVAQQLEQLQGLEGGGSSKDAIGVSDLEQQLQVGGALRSVRRGALLCACRATKLIVLNSAA
jgi:hypothetical protein